ncbi:MAG: HlyD family efflux transporter periplasmic adaptor subunit [Deltaproteobacteria bacterium]|nr:HlyD family efflux transporter periplasmic adaptor subunit [Deltaproteobacteria bacterium]
MTSASHEDDKAPGSVPALDIGQVESIHEARARRWQRWGRPGVVFLLLSAIAVIPCNEVSKGVCTLSAIRYSYVKAPFAAIVKRVLVRTGNQVKRDQPLIILDDRELRANLQAARARQTRARAELRLANRRATESAIKLARAELKAAHIAVATTRARCRRLRNLVNKGVLAQTQLDACDNEIAQLRTAVVEKQADLINVARKVTPQEIAGAKAILRAADAEVTHLLEKISRLELRSSMTGVVITERVDELVGRRVPPGHELLQIIDDSEFEARVDFPVVDIPLIAEGATIRLTTTGHVRREIFAKIADVAAEAAKDGKTLTVIAKLTNDYRDLRHGMNLDAETIVRETTVIGRIFHFFMRMLSEAHLI